MFPLSEWRNPTWPRPLSLETQSNGSEVLETREWIDSLDYVLSAGGPERAGRLLQQLSLHARRAAGVNLPFTANTPYINTIPARQQAPFPGSQEMERRIKSLVRWNALAMVVRANKCRRASAATSRRSLRPRRCMRSASITSCARATPDGDRDVVYFQGHAAPGIYSRAFLEGRIPKRKAGELPPRAETRAAGCRPIRTRG